MGSLRDAIRADARDAVVSEIERLTRRLAAAEAVCKSGAEYRCLTRSDAPLPMQFTAGKKLDEALIAWQKECD